jgi:putative flippase GtrA
MTVPSFLTRFWPLALQFLRYVAVGGVAFVVDFGLMVLLREQAGLHHLVAATISFLCGLVVNYLLALAWVFEHRTHEDRVREFIWYGVIGVVGVGLNAAIIAFFADGLGLHYTLAKLIASAVILMFNFGTRRQLLFNPDSRYNAEALEQLAKRRWFRRKERG